MRHTLKMIRMGVKSTLKKYKLNSKDTTFNLRVSQLTHDIDSFRSYDFNIKGIDALIEKISDIIKSKHICAKIDVYDETISYFIVSLAFEKKKGWIHETWAFWDMGDFKESHWKTELHKI